MKMTLFVRSVLGLLALCFAGLSFAFAATYCNEPDGSSQVLKKNGDTINICVPFAKKATIQCTLTPSLKLGGRAFFLFSYAFLASYKSNPGIVLENSVNTLTKKTTYQITTIPVSEDHKQGIITIQNFAYPSTYPITVSCTHQ